MTSASCGLDFDQVSGATSLTSVPVRVRNTNVYRVCWRGDCCSSQQTPDATHTTPKRMLGT